MPILAILYTRGGCSSHSNHEAKEGSQSTKGISFGHKEGRFKHKWGPSEPMMQGDDFASKPGEIMKVAMWLYAHMGFGSSLGLIPNYGMSCWV